MQIKIEFLNNALLSYDDEKQTTMLKKSKIFFESFSLR